ncbi:hypothetical protein N9B72_01815 [Bacteriovoracaceae bacterium]|nr:hypothetical protein [Bacteriovoracaceae bacterium]
MLKLQVVFIVMMILLGSSSAVSALEVSEKNQDIIHINDLDRAKIQKKKAKDLESQLDKTLIEFNQLDPANKQGSDLESEDKKVKPDKDKLPGILGNILGGFKSSMIKKLLKTNPMSRMGHDQLKKMLKQRLKGTKYGTVLEKNETLLDIIVELIRDKKALPELVSILDKADKLLTYFYSFIALFILAMLLNIFMFAKARVFKRIMFKILLTVSMPIVNLAIFYFMFKENLDPTVAIIKTYLF